MSSADSTKITTAVAELSLRFATEADIDTIHGFICKLADYEKLSHEVKASPDDLRNHLFGKRPVAEVVLACWQDEPVGFALFFHNYSTFLGKPGIYLEDLFVDPHMRGRGIGKILLMWLAALAVERGCGRLEWSVLDWNTPAIDFYRSLGSRAMDDWTAERLSGDSLQALAARFATGL